MKFQEFLNNKAKDFEKILDERLKIKEPKKLYMAMRYLPMLGGKRLRPLMAYLSCRALRHAPNTDSKEVYIFGAVLEMIHNFTLIHDDIMDNDPTRRGHKSVHEKFGLEAGINAGDALFAEAFEFLAESPLEPSLVKQLVKDVALMSKGIVEGQQMDVDFESTINSVKIEDYLKMIEKKTALLFQIAAKGGALIAGASQEDVKNMEEFGRLSGIAFQICDDLLDIVGVEKEIGKPKWSDIRKGKKTLMVIHALQHASDEEKKILKKALGKRNASDEEVEAAVSVMEKLGSISNARKLAKEYRDKAKKCLEKIPDSEYRRLLFDLTDFMVERIK